MVASGARRRIGWSASLVALVLVAAGLSAPAGSSTARPGDGWVVVDGDMVVAAGAAPLAARAGTRAAGQGFGTLPSTTGNLGSYEIVLIESTGVESMRDEVERAAAEVSAATGGDVHVRSGLGTDSIPGRGEITVVMTPASPCNGQAWIGCGGVQTVTGSIPDLVATSGKVWLHPDVLDLDARNAQHVVSHELGHALGLVHYDLPHRGEPQVMHSSSYDAESYRSGDLTGLRYLHDGGPSVPANNDFRSPYVLPGELPNITAATTGGADREPGEPQHAGDPGGSSVWFSWTAPATQEVTVEIIEATFDTVVGVYRGDALGELEEVAANDDGPLGPPHSATRLRATAGTTYRIAIDGADGALGAFVVRVRPWVVGPFSSDVAFVDRQYRDFLGSGRPTLAELLTTVEALQSARVDAADVIVSLARSDERLASLGPVTRLYLAYFERTPDTAGLRYWVGRHRRGATLSSISSTFAASSEFETNYGELDDRAFVDLVYRNVLGRDPDESGEAYWLGQLVDQTRGWLMTQFSESSEHVRSAAEEVDVVSLRLGMLRELPSSDLFDANVTELSRGNPLQQIAGRILVGQSYAERLGF